MNVPASERKESKLEVIACSLELHSMLIELMQRNFGIKNVDDVVRSRYAHGQSKTEDFSQYRYLLSNFKNRIDNISSRLTNNLRSANTIYPTSMHEYEQRREFQNNAIVDCEQLINELQQVVDIFNVDVNVYYRYIKVIDREIGLIKNWRQHDNKIKSHL